MSDEYTIRPFETIEEYRECVALQEDTWGHGFSERVAPAILKVSQILGGVAAGAYDRQGTLTGFVFGMTGLRDGELAHWSDMLAVRPEGRDSGLGTRLKAYQRDEVLSRGVETMYWTFDPLQSRNAYLNFNKLGIVVREYVRDMYGQTDSPLHAGIGTDRFIAHWELTSDRVAERLAAALAGERATTDSAESEPVGLALEAETSGAHPTPGEPRLDVGNESVGVQIPSDVVSLMRDDLELARTWRSVTRATFTHYLANDLEVRELLRGDATATYVMAPRPA